MDERRKSMQINIRDDHVEIEGYVNAIERNSKPLWSRLGRFVERICKGAFAKALQRNDDVQLRLNHNPNRVIGSQKQGNLELNEDNIGLHVRASISDKEIMEKAINGDLVGWSFGFFDMPEGVEESRDVDSNLPLRKVKDLNLVEVSILDREKTPAYDGTLVYVRDDEPVMYYSEDVMEEPDTLSTEERAEESDQTEQETVESVEIKQIDYSKWENLINDMREV